MLPAFLLWRRWRSGAEAMPDWLPGACQLLLPTLLIAAAVHGLLALIGSGDGAVFALGISLFGAFCLALCLRAFRRGSARPYAEGFNDRYRRTHEPVRFWLSLGWNGLIGLFVLLVAFGLGFEERPHPDEDACFEERDSPAAARVAACTRLLAEPDLGPHDRGLALHFRSLAREELGDFRSAEGDIRAAISAYGEAIAEDPNNATLYLNSAQAFHTIGAYKPAREALDAFILLAPEDGHGFLRRGLVNLDEGRFSDAVSDFTRAHQRLPGEAWPLVNRGIAHAHMRNAAAARADLDAARKLEPGNLGLHRGEALLALQEGEEEKALGLLTEAVQRDRTDRWSAAQRTAILHRRDREAAAAEGR